MTIRGVRRAGLSLIEVIVVIAIASVLIGLLLGAVQKVRATAARTTCADNVRQLGLALHQYDADHGSLPPGVEPTNSRYAYLNWQARLLPYLEQSALWAQVKLAYQRSPYFGQIPPHTAQFKVVKVFGCPADGRVFVDPPVRAGLTSYLGVSGTVSRVQDGCLYLGSQTVLRDLRDGTSQTLLIGERPPSTDLWIGWWYAGMGHPKNGTAADAILGVCEDNRADSFLSESKCAPGPYHYGGGSLQNQCDLFHFWSLHSGGANFLFADGSVHFLPYSARDVMAALATRAGGEVAAAPD